MGKIVLPVVAGLTLIETTQQLRWLAWTITLSQGYVAYDLNVSYYDGFNRLQFTGFGGMDNNFYVVSLLTGVGVAFFLGITERTWWQKLLALLCAALMAHAVFFSFSRGGMLGLWIVIGVSFLVLPKTPKLMGLFAASAILALMMAGPQVRERFASAFVNEEDRDSSAQSRIELSNVCLQVIKENPILGIGPNHFRRNAASYGLAPGKSAHTMWLETAAEIGIPGVLLLSSFYGLTIMRLLAFLRKEREAIYSDEYIKAVPRMVIASLIGFCVSAQFVSVVGLEIPYYVALLGVGALKVESARAAQLVSDESEQWFGRRFGAPIFAPTT
jgi:O-antigen ligase